MIDSLSILLSTLACLFVLFRAVRLDRLLPWFETVDELPGAGAAGQTPTSTGPADPWEQ